VLRTLLSKKNMLLKWLLAIFDLVKVLRGKENGTAPCRALSYRAIRYGVGKDWRTKGTHCLCGWIETNIKLIQKLVFSEIGADLNNLKAKKVAVLTDAKVQV
jgi:hypothetical protein